MNVRNLIFFFCTLSVTWAEHCKDRVLVGGPEGKFAVSNDGGKTWSSRNTAQNGYIHSILEPEYGHIIFGSTNGLWTSRNDGSTWKGYETSGYFNSIAANTTKSIFGLDLYGALYVSNDGGDTWPLNYTLPSSVYCAYVALYVNGQKSYVGCWNDDSLGLLYLDASAKNPSWTKIDFGSTLGNKVNAIAGDGHRIYAGMYQDGAPLVVTNDDFATMTTILLDQQRKGNYIKAIATGPNSVYASVWGSGVAVIEARSLQVVIKSTANGLASNQVYSLAASANGCVYAATDNGLSISRDGGQTWITKTTQDGLPSNTVLAVYAKKRH